MEAKLELGVRPVKNVAEPFLQILEAAQHRRPKLMQRPRQQQTRLRAFWVSD
jgi:hypothetical protein